MKKRQYHKYCICQGLKIMIAVLLLSSCYQTKNIPQDDYLYKGIKDLAYGHKWGEKVKKDKDSEGVITAVANAYNAVEDVLTGNTTSTDVLQQQRELSKEEKDSIKASQLQDNENYETTEEEINGVFSIAPNGSIMGSSKYSHPFTIGLWVWNRYTHSHTMFGKWMLNSFGSSPVLLSNVAPAIRTQVAHNTLCNYGYFHNDVQYRVDSTRNPRKKKVSYQVLPGDLFHLGDIQYLDFRGKADSIVRHTISKTLLHKGDPFSVPTLSNERDRLCNLFRDNGYYFLRSEYVTYRADTIQQPLTVHLQVSPAKNIPSSAMYPYHIGHTYITIYKYNDEQFTDSFTHGDVSLRWSGGKPKKSPLRLGIIRRYLHFQKGDLYSQTASTNTQNQLSGIGVFSNLQLNYVPRDTTLITDPVTGEERPMSDTLDVHLTAMLDKPYTSEFEAKITNKTNGLLGPGVSYSINRKNAFHRAETLSFGISGSYEWQTGANMRGDNTAINSWSLNADIDLNYPRFMFLNRKIGRKLNKRMTCSTLFKADVKWMNRAAYYGSAGVGIRVKWTFQQKPNILHEFTPIHLEFNRLLNHTQKFDSIMDKNPALYASLKDKLVPSIEYSFNWTTPTKQIHQARINFTTKQALQFQKYTFDYTHKLRLTTRSQFVVHTGLGFLYQYGGVSAPYSDLLFVGGANSIRGFGVRSIGPGSYHPANSSYSYLNQVGDMKFELNLEYRFPIVGNLYGATFIDAGNTWLLEEDKARPGGKFSFKNLGKELATSTGIGLRYDLDFLVIRFDVGIGIHAPYDTGKHGYYNMPSFGKSLGYHIAIGYPF